MANRICRRSWRDVFRRLAVAGAIVALIVSNGSLTQAFQSALFTSSAPRLVQHPAAGFYSIKPAATTSMRYGPLPWDPDCGGLLEPFQSETDGLQSPLGSDRFGARILASPSVAFQRPGLQIGDPHVADTVDSYQLTFSLPTEVEQSYFDASVSGSLLTIKVHVTRESSGDDTKLGGWVITRSSRTDSTVRSFLLPNRVLSSSVETVWLSHGRVQVRFNKDNYSNNMEDSRTAVSQKTTAAPIVGSKTGSDKSLSSPTSAQYLSSLSKPSASAVAGGATTESDAGAPKSEEPKDKSVSPQSHGMALTSAKKSQSPPIGTSSLFDTMEQELDEFTKAFRKKFVLRRLPKWEEMAERAEAAREAKARRVAALRRETMDVNVSETEDGDSYLVKVDLPEEAVRDNVSLAVLPNNALRVTFARNDGRLPVLHKDVRLPKDAQFSQVSAKFDVEEVEDAPLSSPSSSSVEGSRVSSLRVTVGKAVKLELKNIDIL